MKEEANGTGTLSHGYWMIAFVDLLGQKDAFLKTDYLPNGDDPAKREAFALEVQASVGVIRTMRRLLDAFREATRSVIADDSMFKDYAPGIVARVRTMRERRIVEHRLSDGVMLACPLQPSPGHGTPTLGVYDILCTCASLMLVQLAAKRPIRGGLDVGTGMEVDGELFGASLVKAYVLESQRAKQPRLAVGPTLVDYLTAGTRAPGEGLEQRFERLMATKCLDLLTKDEDGLAIVDYAGKGARELMDGTQTPVLVRQAQAFAHECRDRYQRLGKDGETLFERYSKVAGYLDARVPLWG